MHPDGFVLKPLPLLQTGLVILNHCNHYKLVYQLCL
jgi:hypothetical protein